MCGGSQDLITLLTGLTFADSSRIHETLFLFSLHDKPKLSHGVSLFFCPLSGPNESGTKHLSKQCQAVDASQNTCVTLSFNQKIEGRCSEKVTDFNEEIANRTSENDAKQTLGGLAQSLPQDKSARIHTQIIHLEVKESNHSRSEIPKVVQPDLQIRLCSTPRLISLELNTKVQISIKLDS